MQHSSLSNDAFGHAGSPCVVYYVPWYTLLCACALWQDEEGAFFSKQAAAGKVAQQVLQLKAKVCVGSRGHGTRFEMTRW